MSQVLRFKNKGEFTFEKTYVNGTLHIGKLVGGGYCHLGGMPIKNLEELRSVIPDGPELDSAVDWYKNRGKAKLEEKPKRVIIATKDGFSFLDGPINSVQDIMNNLPPGPTQENILAWYGQKIALGQREKKNLAIRAVNTSQKIEEIRKEQMGDQGAGDSL